MTQAKTSRDISSHSQPVPAAHTPCALHNTPGGPAPLEVQGRSDPLTREEPGSISEAVCASEPDSKPPLACDSQYSWLNAIPRLLLRVRRPHSGCREMPL